MPENEFLDAASLKREVIKHLDNETFFFTRHAIEEQEKDGLDFKDVLHVLRYGTSDRKRSEFHNKFQTWRYGIKGKTEENKTAVVIVSFKDKMMIITVFKIGKYK